MSKLYFWLGTLIIGAILGYFMKPKTLTNTGIVVMIIAIVGLLVSGFLSNENATWTFGIACMVIPPAFTVAWLGAFISEKLKRAFIQKEATDNN